MRKGPVRNYKKKKKCFSSGEHRGPSEKNLHTHQIQRLFEIKSWANDGHPRSPGMQTYFGLF